MSTDPKPNPPIQPDPNNPSPLPVPPQPTPATKTAAQSELDRKHAEWLAQLMVLKSQIEGLVLPPIQDFWLREGVSPREEKA